MGVDKSIVLGGSFKGATVAVEVSADGGNTFWPLWLFSAAGKKVIPVAANAMRVNVSGYSGAAFSANCDVGASGKTSQFVTLPMPAGSGGGAPVDVSALGSFTTFVATGPFVGTTISVEISEDGVDYAACGASFSDRGGIRNRVVIANFMRAHVRGGSPSAFAPIVAVCAIDDASGGAGTDELVKVSNTDTTPGFLDAKIVAGSGVALAVLGSPGDEDLEISVSGADAGDIVTGPPIPVRGGTNAEGGGAGIARAEHQHRLELEVEDEGAIAGARPAINFVGAGVGAADDPGNDRVNVTIPGNVTDGASVVRSTYVGASTSTSGNSFVDGMSGLDVTVPIDGDYWAIWEGEFMNSNGNAVLEVGVGVNSTTLTVANSERDNQGNASDMGNFTASIYLGALVAGDLVRGLFRKKSGPQSVSIIRRNLTIFKVQ
jgi:hypothetical protein